MHIGVQNDVNWILTCFIHERRNGPLKLIKKLVTGLMILLVALGSSPLEVSAIVSDPASKEWPRFSPGNGIASDLPEPPATKDIVNLSQMFNYPTLDYGGIPRDSGTVLTNYTSMKSYVTKTDSSVAVLTRDSTWQAGVMWSLDNYKVKLNEPFHMISYVYLGNKGQVDGGADGITFTMQNDKKNETLSDNDRKVLAGNVNNYGINAYGALGNGLGIYGSNFSAADGANRYVYMRKGVTNGIALEFDTFYNDEKGLSGKQFADTDLWKYIEMGIPNVKPTSVRQGTPNTNYGHIAINYLNQMQNNIANDTGQTFDKVPKHAKMLSVGWDGAISGLDYQEGWKVSSNPTKKLADNNWHRLEVKWKPKSQTTGDLTYIIYRQGHKGDRNVSSIYDTSNDTKSSEDILTYTISDLNVKDVFGVTSTADSVYWGFTGSTGGYKNNQAVQMLQLPAPYYKSGIRKVDQDGNLVKNAKFQLQVLNGGTWQPVEFQKADGSGTQDYVLTGVDNGLIGVTTDLDGKVTATQLLAGTYRWFEIEAPEGYQKNQEYYPSETGFVVNYFESQKENAFNFTATNKKLYQLELIKTDSDTQRPLNNVPFIISKTVKTENENDKQYYLKLNADTKGFEWTEDEAKAKQFLSGKSYVLDENGQISEQARDDGKLIVKYFPDAPNLSWKEVSVPAGYDSSGTLEGSFSTPVDNKYLYQATQKNSRLYQVSLEKKASDTNAALPGAVFSLEQQVRSEWKAVGDSKTTGEDGKITISNLKTGTYRWKEVTAPDGYQISQPDQNGFKVEYNSNLAIDKDTNNYIFNTTSVTNAPRDFELTLEKLSSTLQKPLQGVEFKLYDSAGGTDFSTLIPKATRTTDADGKIVLKKEQIQAGKTYYLVESQTVDGFIQLKGYFTITTDKLKGFTVTYTKADSEADANPFVFTSTSTDTSYAGTLKIYNKQKSILPTTGGSGRTGYFIASLIFMGLVAIIGGIFYYRNRRLRHHQLLKGPNNKSHLLLLLLITSLGITFTNTQKIAADEQPITFILHKRVFKDSGDLKTIKDNGLVITPNDPNSGVIDSDKTYGLNGVTFDVYDVTSYVSNALKSTSKEALMKHVTNTDKASLLAEIKPYQPTSQEVVTVSSDGDDGVARFSVQPTSQNSAYLILEKQISDKDAGKVKMTATPMLVILPVANPVDKTSYLTTINLYPKNTAVKTPVIPPVNPVNPKPPDFPFLPDTGEVKSVMVVLGGIVVIIAVSFWYNRRKPKPS